MSRKNFQVAIENAIRAIIFGIHNVALNLGPKLLGLNKSKQIEESKKGRSGEKPENLGR